MSKFLLIPLAAAALLTPAGAAPANATETCATAPTCAELGYTLTSTTNCVGTPLKCPFDKTKFFCTTKQEAAAAAMPDYSKAAGRSLGVTYTAATNGYIYGYDKNNSDSWTGNYYVYIDGRNVRISEAQTGFVNVMWTYPVKKGSTYRVTKGNGEVYYFFVPSN